MISDIRSAQGHPHFFKAPFRFTKIFQITRQIVVFSPKIWPLLCRYLYQNSSKTIKSLLQPVWKRRQEPTEVFFYVTRTRTKNLGLRKNVLLRILRFILVWETCFPVMVVIDTKPKVKAELQTVTENSANSQSIEPHG